MWARAASSSCSRFPSYLFCLFAPIFALGARPYRITDLQSQITRIVHAVGDAGAEHCSSQLKGTLFQASPQPHIRIQIFLHCIVVLFASDMLPELNSHKHGRPHFLGNSWSSILSYDRFLARPERFWKLPRLTCRCAGTLVEHVMTYWTSLFRYPSRRRSTPDLVHWLRCIWMLSVTSTEGRG